MTSLISFVPLALLIFIAWVTTWAVLRSRRERSSAASIERVSGVGGWLLFLIVGLMWIGPLIAAGVTNSGIRAAETEFPALKATPAWRTFTSTTWWTFLALWCLSFYAGLGLARGRDRAVVFRAQIVLWLLGPGGVLLRGIVIPFLAFGRLAPLSQLLGWLIASTAAAAIWSLYLSKSRRVRVTYGGPADVA
jgi:hypothetical protein